MIQKTQSYQTTDGKIWATLDLAQRHELVELLLNTKDFQAAESVLEAVAQCMVTQREHFLDILSTSPRSLPKARKIHGGTKTRKAVAPITSIVAA